MRDGGLFFFQIVNNTSSALRLPHTEIVPLAPSPLSLTPTTLFSLYLPHLCHRKIKTPQSLTFRRIVEKRGKKLGVKKNGYTKKNWGKKIGGEKKMGVQKKIGGDKKNWGKKIGGKKKMGVQKLGVKILEMQKLGVKNF